MNNKKLFELINEIADEVESKKSYKNVTIAVNNFGSEISEDNVNKALDGFSDVKFILVGQAYKDYEYIEASSDEEVHNAMSKLFKEEKIDAAVAMHYPFPIGVSTVGKIVSPANGKEVYIATTTGTTHTKREIAMVLNAINGIIAAKSNGIENPTLGILNIEGAKIVEKKLQQLKENGFEINFTSSKRADGGCVLRGNDLVAGICDIIVTDSLTGNVLTKTFASYTSGGYYETVGYGYGPGIGENYKEPVFIISRASGTPVIRNAIQYAVDSSLGDINKISKEIYAEAKKAGLDEILKSLDKKEEHLEEVKMPEKETVTETISGIDILEIDSAINILWKENIYAQSAMGCTGPLVMVSKENIEKAKDLLEKANLID